MVSDMMNSTEFNEHLAHLNLGPAEAAQLLSVSSRTLRRWIDGEEIPGPAEAALRAWRKLSDRHLAWKPDSVSVFEDDQDQIARHRRHTEEMTALIARVEARGGAKDPWTVDLPKNSATFGNFEVGFYNLQSGGFSLSNYRRKDMPPDLARDWPFLEDAAYCISTTFSKARASGQALNAVGQHVRQHSSVFVVDGPRMLTPAQRTRRRQEIEALADKIDELATTAAAGKARYAEFEDILSKLHAAGFFPEMSLISAVAKAMV
jgi:hypothetical protein